MSSNLMQNRVSHPTRPSLDKNNAVTEISGSYKRVSLSGDDDAGYIPVSCLNTFTHDWAIKVRMVKKYPMKSWNNARG